MNMNDSKSFFVFELETGLLHEYDDGTFKTLLFGFRPGRGIELGAGYTHFGIVVQGRIMIESNERHRQLVAGDYFSVVGPARLGSEGTGMVVSAFGYTGVNVFGGPIEDVGRLRYIDGCSDSLIVPPVRKGDPCLNHLHFPAGIRQTPHTHPSVRIGVVYRGAGECVLPNVDPVPLRSHCAFLVPTNSVHSFNTARDTMDVVAFHPDSDAGMTDDDHPMVNRTIVDGVSARFVRSIRTPAT